MTVLLFFFFRGQHERPTQSTTTKELSLSLPVRYAFGETMRLEIGADDAPAAPLREGHPKLEDTGTLNNKKKKNINPKHGTFLFSSFFFLFFSFPKTL